MLAVKKQWGFKMTIIVKNLRRPGQILDSSKLAQLGAMVSSSIKSRSNGRYIATSRIQGNQLAVNVRQLNPETGAYVKTTKDEQIILAGRISSFLQQQGISADVQVK